MPRQPTIPSLRDAMKIRGTRREIFLAEVDQLTKKLFAAVNACFADKGGTLRSGTLGNAPASTKNKARAHDPEMSSTKKGNDSYLGMKAHVGVDAGGGIVRSLETTTARTHGSHIWDELLHGKGKPPCADAGNTSAAQGDLHAADIRATLRLWLDARLPGGRRRFRARTPKLCRAVRLSSRRRGRLQQTQTRHLIRRMLPK